MQTIQKHKTVLLVLLTLTQLLVIVDGSIVNIALPAIKSALHFSNGSLQWIITAYILFFGGTLLLGGRLADRFGRRRLLATGTAAFTLASLLLGLSQISMMLIALRAVQGISAAMMTSAALAILLATFRESHERNKALSIWGLAGSAGGALGVLLGGVLTEHLGWRAIFFVNVPIGALVWAGILRHLPHDDTKAVHERLDFPGAVSITAGIMALVYALSQVPHIGWTALVTIVSGLIGLILCASFVYIEKRSLHPIVPLSIFGVRSVSIGNIAMLILTAIGMAQFYFNSLYIQNILHYSSEEAGLAFLPIPLAVALSIAFVPRLLKKFGYRYVLMAGALLMGTGAYMLTTFTIDSSYVAAIVPAFLLLGAGFGMAVVSTNVAATSGVAHEQSGIVSGLINTSQQIGGALGIAVLTVVASQGVASGGFMGMYNYHVAYLGILGLIVLLIVTALSLGKPADSPVQY